MQGKLRGLFTSNWCINKCFATIPQLPETLSYLGGKRLQMPMRSLAILTLIQSSAQGQARQGSGCLTELRAPLFTAGGLDLNHSMHVRSTWLTLKELTGGTGCRACWGEHCADRSPCSEAQVRLHGGECWAPAQLKPINTFQPNTCTEEPEQITKQ